MPVVTDLRYTVDSVHFEDRFQKLVHEQLRQLVRERLVREKRDVVTEQDVRECMPAAVKNALAEMKIEGTSVSTEPDECGDR